VSAPILLLAGLLLAAPADVPGGVVSPGEEARPHAGGEPEIDRVVVLATVRVSGSAFDLLRFLGAAGVLVEEHEIQAVTSAGTIYAVRGRAASPGATDRLAALAAREPRVQLLFHAFAVIEERAAAEPVPLKILTWSPVLYPSPASVLTRGPVAGRHYYVSPRTGEVLEAAYDGSEFRTAFTAVGPPPYIEGGVGLGLTGIYWRQRVEAWQAKQERIRSRGWEKYGWIFEEPPGGALTREGGFEVRGWQGRANWGFEDPFAHDGIAEPRPGR
jgi:hypothetical protein